MSINNHINLFRDSAANWDGDLFVLSSKWEEVGFVIVEAAMSNLFVISSDCPNGPTEFLEKGKNGILFKNNQKWYNFHLDIEIFHRLCDLLRFYNIFFICQSNSL